MFLSGSAIRAHNGFGLCFNFSCPLGQRTRPRASNRTLPDLLLSDRGRSGYQISLTGLLRGLAKNPSLWHSDRYACILCTNNWSDWTVLINSEIPLFPNGLVTCGEHPWRPTLQWVQSAFWCFDVALVSFRLISSMIFFTWLSWSLLAWAQLMQQPQSINCRKYVVFYFSYGQAYVPVQKHVKKRTCLFSLMWRSIFRHFK